MAEYKIRVIASPCKDDKDRGNASKGVDEALINLRCGLHNDDSALHRLYVRTLAPFIIKYEGIIDHRLHPLLDLLNHIARLKTDQKNDIKKYRPISNYKIERIEDEEALYPIHTDIASTIPLRETQFATFSDFIKTACPKAGTVYLPTALSKVLYNSSSPQEEDNFRDPRTKEWNLKNLKTLLERRFLINNRECLSIPDLETALDIASGTLYANGTDLHFGRLACLTKRAVNLTAAGLEEFLSKNSPYPRKDIRPEWISPPQFTSYLDKEGPHWTNIIDRDCVLKYKNEEIPVHVRAVINSFHKETRVMVSRIRND